MDVEAPTPSAGITTPIRPLPMNGEGARRASSVDRTKCRVRGLRLQAAGQGEQDARPGCRRDRA